MALSPLDQAAERAERRAAATDDASLVRFHAKWDRALARLQRAHPARWSVRGRSQEEVRAELTLRLLEVVRGDPAAHEAYEADAHGRTPWAVVVMRARLAELRRAHRLDARPEDLREAPLPPMLPEPEDQEARCLAAEADAGRALARLHAEGQLTRPQRRWYAAMRMAANGGAFFQASEELNLSAAARVLGKHRSSAQRAYEEIRAVFQRERARRA